MAQPQSFFEEQSDQSRVKALIVSSYFLRWARVMKGNIKRYPAKHPKKCMAYIDLFAGPGKYAEGAISTPVMVMQEAMKDPEVQEMLVAYFNDREPEHVQSLQQTILALPGIKKFKHAPQFANQEVGESLVAEFEAMRLVPTLAFVDPFGYKGLLSRIHAEQFKSTQGTLSNEALKSNKMSIGIAMAFDLFDTFGYWPDKRKKLSQLRGSQVDVLHASHASGLKALVTADARFAKKAEAVFWYYKLPCKVLDTNAALEELGAQHDRGPSALEWHAGLASERSVSPRERAPASRRELRSMMPPQPPR